MKKISYLIVLCLTFLSAHAQDEIKFDGLKAPSSPAFNLLGISPSSIDRPVDLTSFAVSVQNATSDFSSIPNNYAMEFLPFTLFGKNPMTTKELAQENFKDVFKQTFLISVGVANELNDELATAPKLTKIGVGLKFSFIRPAFNDSTVKRLADLNTVQGKITKLIARNLNEIQKKDTLIKKYEALRKQIESSELPELDKTKQLLEVTKLLQMRRTELYIEVNQEINESREKNELLELEVREKAKALNFKRSGAFLDFAMGSVVDFKDETFNRSQLSKAGAWLTGGWIKESWDILLITRYLYQPDKLLADDTGLLPTENVSSLDGGFRAVYKTLQKQQLSLSAEGLYRSVLESDSLKPSWRLVGNASYDFGSNRIVTFSLGKDFDHTFIKEDNLVATLNFIIGFGNTIQNEKTP